MNLSASASMAASVRPAECIFHNYISHLPYLGYCSHEHAPLIADQACPSVLHDNLKRDDTDWSCPRWHAKDKEHEAHPAARSPSSGLR